LLTWFFLSPQTFTPTPFTHSTAHKQKKTKIEATKGKGKEKEKEKDQDAPGAVDMEVDDQEAPVAGSPRDKTNSRYSPMLFFENLDDNSFVVVERPWLSIIQKFPAPLYRPRYGT